MSEDLLEEAIEAMKNEQSDPEAVESARKRVWQKIGAGNTSVCVEFQSEFQDYLEGKLTASRRLLMADHLSRCPQCRTHLAELKGEHKVAVMPERRQSRWPRRAAWMAIAAAAIFALYLGRNNLDTMLAPSGPIATVDSIDGSLFLVPDGSLKTGGAIKGGEVVRTASGTHARLRLNDGSLVDVNEGTELFLRGAWSGNSIQLQRGDILVQAAKQRRGRLRVETRDSLTSVKGTIFSVSSGLSGTLVSVVEGSVAVRYSGGDVLLSPGEQTATNPILRSSVERAISWSPDAGTYAGMMASLAQVEKQIGELPSPQLRTESRLIQYMPPNMFIYGALPNIGDSLDQAAAIMEQQASENSDFSQWWDFGGGRELKVMIDRIQTITPNLGNEIVYGVAAIAPGSKGKIPVILAEVQPGRESRLEDAIRMLSGGTNPFPLPYYLDDTILVASDSQQNLDWLQANLGRGADSPFASEIAARYSNGVGWLLGIDVSSIISLSGDETEFIRAQQVKHLFFDQRDAYGTPENELAVTFNGPRMGLPSLMADTGSGGAAEYISGETLAAGYISTREPQQLFEELLSQFDLLDPSFLDHLNQLESKLGIDISNDLVYALGTESAFSLESISTAGPAWTMAVLVNDAGILDDSIRRIVEAVNAGMEAAGRSPGFTYSRDSVNGREWNTLQAAGQKLISLTWTYDRGYLVAGSDRGTVLRAIATRDSGLSLAWSAAFRQQLPASAGLHPSGFAWLNTQGAFQGLAVFIRNPVLQNLIKERDPILVVFNADAEQIRAVSRTRISSVLMDLILLQDLGKTGAEQQASRLQ